MRITRNGWDKVLAWLLSLVFAAAATAKLAGDPGALAAFPRFGLPAWFVQFTVAVELAGALGVHWRRGWPALVGPGLLAATMGVAAGLHLAHDPPAMAVPAIALFLVSATLLAMRLHARAKAEPRP